MSLWWRQAGMKASGRMVQEGWDEMKLWTREVYVSDKDDNNETDKWFLWLLLGTFENKQSFLCCFFKEIKIIIIFPKLCKKT